jgi:ADP-ribose pyrophosphatase YjhB (NUDIX family)
MIVVKRMNFCSQCGSRVEVKVPEGDNRPRHICIDCGVIHYQNPNVVTGCIPEWEGKVLLCRRAIEPRRGYWTLPAGFLENGESTQEGALRETIEEANARVLVGPLYTLFSLPHIDQIYMLFRGPLQDLDYGPGVESLEVKLFTEKEIPWDELAFQVIAETLKYYFEDRRRGEFRLRSGVIERLPGTERRYRTTLHE